MRKTNADKDLPTAYSHPHSLRASDGIASCLKACDPWHLIQLPNENTLTRIPPLRKAQPGWEATGSGAAAL